MVCRGFHDVLQIQFNEQQGGQSSLRSMVSGSCSYPYHAGAGGQRSAAGGRRQARAYVDGLMERDLLSRVTGERPLSQGHDQDPRPPPSPTLSLRVGTDKQRQGQAADDSNRGNGHEPQQQAAATAANAFAQLPSSSRLHFAPDGPLASVVVPGCPMSERRHHLRAGASPAGPGPAPQRPPMAPPVRGTLELAVAGPTVTTRPGQQERCDACGVSARLLRGLSSDLDRARAQVALLTCQNESLRHRLKRASAAAGQAECPAASSSAHLSLRSACRVRPATVLLVPREHLCLCGHCSSSSRGGSAVACPVCRAAVGAWPAEAAPR